MDLLPGVELKCDFNIDSLELYRCKVEGPSILKRCIVASLKGNHQIGKTTRDVESLTFQKLAVLHLPSGLGNFFPNLIKLNIFDCGLKQISSDNLIGLENLEELWANDNLLISLPDDLFTHTRKLARIDFSCNKLDFMSSKILDPLDIDNLEVIDFRLNKIIDKIYFPGHDESVESVDDMKKHLDSVRPFPVNAMTVARRNVADECPVSGSRPISVSSFAQVKAVTAVKHNEALVMENLPCFEKIWKLGKFSDFTVVAGARKFHVHKCVLAVQSSFFASMFENDEEVMNSNTLEIKGYSEESVEVFLHFLYTSRVMEAKNPLEVYSLVSTFNDEAEVSELKSRFESISISNISKQNALTALKLGNLHNCTDMIDAAFEIIKQMIPMALGDHLKNQPEKLEKILEKFLSIQELIENENHED